MEYIVNDFAYIAQRIKEIQKEQEAATPKSAEEAKADEAAPDDGWVYDYCF
jgi:hypothetical protein